MIKIVLIRPGTTDFDEQGRIKGTLDIPLNANGNQQIRQAASQLANQSIEIVYTSPCRAAEESAQLLSQELRVKTKTLPSLKNVNQGLWQGKLIDEVRQNQRKVYRQWQEQPETVCPPEGEMIGSARHRVLQALGKLLRSKRSGAVALVAPEPLASLIRCSLKQSELGDLWQAERACGQWELLEVSPEQITAG